MSLSLYQITEQYKQIAESLIESGGEVSPDIEEALKINQQNLQEKAVNYGYIIKQSELECDMIDAEIQRLTKMKKARQNAIEELKARLTSAMTYFEINEIKSPTMKLSFRKSESVEIINEALIPDQFKMPQAPKILKMAIKEALKNGEPVNGAIIETNYNLQIK